MGILAVLCIVLYEVKTRKFIVTVRGSDRQKGRDFQSVITMLLVAL